MKINKKGMTLMELVCGLALISIALIVGLQIWYISSSGTNRSAQFDRSTQKIVKEFEGTGDGSVQLQYINNANVRFQFGGGSYTVQDTLVVGTSTNNGITSTLSILQKSKG